MALSPAEQKEYERLKSRHNRHSSPIDKNGMSKAIKPAKSAAPAEPEKEAKQETSVVSEMKKLTDAVVAALEKKQEAPVINVTVDPPQKSDAAPSAPGSKQWTFEHKYDVYNKLIKTIATCS